MTAETDEEWRARIFERRTWDDVLEDAPDRVALPDGGTEAQDPDRSIEDIAREYLRALDEREAKIEEVLAGWADRYYEPGYLDDDEWERLKALLRDGDTDHARMQLEIAAYRKAATEAGRAHEFDGEWPAKGGGPRA